MSCNDNPAAAGGDLSPMTVIVMLMLTMFLHHLLRRPRAREAKAKNNIVRLADDTAEQLSVDEVAIIFGYLLHQDIMRARVCKTWREAAKKAIVPPSDFVVDGVRSYNAMRVMSTALPNIQQLSIYDLGHGLDIFTNGEDPDEERAAAAETASYTTHDINIISNFRKLRVLEILNAPLNGRYPSLFHFPHLQRLAITYCHNLKWDLDMLASFPLLKELDCSSNHHLTGKAISGV
eukprot:scaffold4795_cov191-Skeletonema_marinoi.AAC.6